MTTDQVADALDELPLAEGVEISPPNDHLAERAARGAGVTLVGQATRIVLQTITVAVLARLLDPHDYGLLAMVLVIVGVGEIFRDFGLSSAAIQAKTLSRQQRDVLFWINTGIGFTLTILVFSGASLVALAFGQPELLHITQVLAITFTINGLATQYRADLTRRLKFGYLVICDIAGQVMGLVVGITTAVLGAGYWALVAQQLSQLGTVLISLVVLAHWLPGRPRRHTGIAPFLKLGGHLAATQGIYYLTNNLDTITIGVRFGSTQLGVYNRGFALLTSPLNSLRSPASTVALPVLSRLQDDFETAGSYIKRAQLTLGYTIVAGLAATAGAAVPIVALMLGPKWSQVAPVLALLAIAGACSTLSYVGLWVYLSRGLGKQLMRYTIVTLVLQAICILVGSIWGIVGVAAGYAVAAALEWPLSLGWLARITSIPVRDLFLGAGRITGAAVAAGATAWAVSRALDQAPVGLTTVAAFAAAAGVYALGWLLVRPVRRDLGDVLGVARKMLKR